MGVSFFLGCATIKYSNSDNTTDAFAWLEDLESKKAYDWVLEQNTATKSRFEKKLLFNEIYKKNSIISTDNSQTSEITILGKHVYNLLQDKKHINGLLRRTRYADYILNKNKWESVFDLDEFSKVEGENWVFKSIKCAPPRFLKCFILMSRGGKDADVLREFDFFTKQFNNRGFYLREAKSDVSWFDENHLLVASDFGIGSLNSSGYGRILKLWKRGTNLELAPTIYEGRLEDTQIVPDTNFNQNVVLNYFVRWKSYLENEVYVFQDRKPSLMRKPDSAELVGFISDTAVVYLKDDWQLSSKLKIKSGSIVGLNYKKVCNSDAMDECVQLIYMPRPKSTILKFYNGKVVFGIKIMKNNLIINAMENVKGVVYISSLAKGKFTLPKKMLLDVEKHHVVREVSDYNDSVLISTKDFLNADILNNFSLNSKQISLVSSAQNKFDSSQMISRQIWAKSKDGTDVPYFIVGKKSVIEAGNAPLILDGYGGFEIARPPVYKPEIGVSWLEHGGIYVLANIRGGSEFGPSWHSQALKENRQRSFDDFISIAEDLVAKKITTAAKLGILGGSNGGLLVGTVMTQRPDLFGAVVAVVPIFDMLRYTKLLEGASWISEYGDPEDSKMREVLLKYSPYQNIKQNVKYPPILILTSTKDDRVHPGHARKMAAKLEAYGNDVNYYENTNGGHAASANLDEKIYMQSLIYSFFAEKLH